jgi:hypothetical protein
MVRLLVCRFACSSEGECRGGTKPHYWGRPAARHEPFAKTDERLPLADGTRRRGDAVDLADGGDPDQLERVVARAGFVPAQNAVELAEIDGENRGVHRMLRIELWATASRYTDGMQGFVRRQEIADGEE